MLGAIIGDVAGSRFEFNNYRSKDFDLFTNDCFATDDSIMSLAVAKAIMKTEKAKGESLNNYNYELLSDLTVKYMQEIGRKYPDCGYGEMFLRWVFSDNPRSYNSFGNGAAMRISPAGFAAKSYSEVCELSEAITKVTHNHEEGIKGAEAAATAVFMAYNGYTKREIGERIIKDYYALDFMIDDIRKTYQFNETCQETVPQAIKAFLESVSFEDSIRTAVSIGGDSDTVAAITGGIAEAYYGVPGDIRDNALKYLNQELRAIYDEWETFLADSTGTQFKVLTKYVGRFSDADTYGELIIDKINDGTKEHPRHFPFVKYSRIADDFVKDFYQFSSSHPEHQLNNYGGILKKNGIEWSGDEMRKADIEKLDAPCVLALIMGIIRADRFSEGTLLNFFENGFILKWLKRLQDI